MWKFLKRPHAVSNKHEGDSFHKLVFPYVMASVMSLFHAGYTPFSLVYFYLTHLEVPCRKHYFNCKICTSFYTVVLFWDIIARYKDDKLWNGSILRTGPLGILCHFNHKSARLCAEFWDDDLCLGPIPCLCNINNVIFLTDTCYNHTQEHSLYIRFKVYVDKMMTGILWCFRSRMKSYSCKRLWFHRANEVHESWVISC